MLRLRLLRFPYLAILSILLLIALLAVVPGVSASSPNSAPPMVTLSPAVGPPTSTVQVHGSHFGSYEAVDVYFDTTDKALAATNGQGAFSISIKVPTKAVPGKHWVSAVGRHSGDNAQAPFLVQTDWPQLGYDHQHTGNNPYENVLSPANVGSLTPAWSVRVGYYLPMPVVANGVIYRGEVDGVLSAFNAQTGAKLWSIALRGDLYPPPAVANGVVYIGSSSRIVYALNAQTGTKLWSIALSYGTTSPVVANGVVYIASKKGKLYALNAQTGAKLWSFQAGGNIVSSPAVANGVVYIGSMNGLMYALNALNGIQIWSAPAGQNTPVVANGIVYSTTSSATYALNAQTGTQLWSVAIGDLFVSAAVANGIVYVGTVNSNVYALNAQTGTQIWSAQAGGMNSTPTVANGVVYVGGNDNKVYAFNAQTGSQLWSATTSDIAASSPVVVNGFVYVGSENSNSHAHIYAYALPPGDQLQPPARPNPATLRPNLTLSVQP